MKSGGDKATLIARRFWFVVGGGVIFVAGLWIFSFTIYRMPLTNNGVDAVVAGPLPLAALIGGVVGGACEYFLERRSCHK